MDVDYKRWGFLQYKGVVTQNNVAGGALSLRVTPGAGNILIIDYGSVGPDSYSGNETVTITIKSNGADLLRTLFTSTTVDNVLIPFPGQITAANVDPGFGYPIIITGTDRLDILTSDLAQNKTLTLNIRGRCLVKPTIVTTGSGGTPSAIAESLVIV